MPSKTSKKAKQSRQIREARKRYAEFVEIQGSETCAICGRPPKKGGRRLAIDHDHKTERIRGLLDGSCNRRLRWYFTPEMLRAMADYLENPPLDSVNDQAATDP